MFTDAQFEKLRDILFSYLDNKNFTKEDYITRKAEVKVVKFAFRRFLKINIGWTHRQIVEFEWRLFNVKTNRSTIIHSINTVEERMGYYRPLLFEIITTYENAPEERSEIKTMSDRIDELVKENSKLKSVNKENVKLKDIIKGINKENAKLKEKTKENATLKGIIEEKTKTITQIKEISCQALKQK